MSGERAPIRVLVVEDREEVRAGLAHLVDTATTSTCVGAFASAEEALEMLERHPVDVMLMDIELPGISGIEAARRVKARWPAVQIMMLTVYQDDERIFESLAAGATGYVLKTTPPARLLQDIGMLHEGGSPMSSAIARRVVETFHTPRPAPAATEGLTPREEEILALLAEGFRYREIAERLFITLDTVRTHIRHIYEKMQVRSRTEATLKYLGRG
ncbi:MAG: response regulator transcription factor [Gemmatimonadota bacterium]|nr:response regulator transcription factor [Gemmatimonadota bacterium]